MNNIEDYCINHSIKESQLLEDIKKFTYENEEAPQMISGRRRLRRGGLRSLSPAGSCAAAPRR